VNIGVTIVALLPDLTLLIVNRVFYQSPADLYMRRMKLEQERPGYLAELDKLTKENGRIE